MPTQMTITTELTREGLQTVRDELDAILASGAPPATLASPLTASARSSVDLDAQAVELKVHLNTSLKRLVRFLVDNYVGSTFTWDDVAKAMQEDVGTVKSWHRSLSKPLNRIGKANPSAPRFLTGSWDGSRNHYTLSQDWAVAIKRTW